MVSHVKLMPKTFKMYSIYEIKDVTTISQHSAFYFKRIVKYEYTDTCVPDDHFLLILEYIILYVE